MNHAFEQSPNGLCAVCGLSMRLCTKAQDKRNERAASETQNKQAVVFGQQIPATCQVVQLATTSRVTLVVTSSGQVFSWGEDCRALGRKVNSPTDAFQVNIIPALRAQFVAKIACGENHVLALLRSFTVWSWGDYESGQLGLVHSRIADEPTVVTGQLLGKVVIDVLAWRNTSFAATLKGTVYMWGDNTYELLQGVGLERVSGHYGHFLPDEYARLAHITTPVEVIEHKVYYGEEEAPQEVNEDVSIAIDFEGNLHLYNSKSNLEVLSASISQEAVSSMSQENSDLRERIRVLQSKYDYIDYKETEMPVEWSKSEDLKILEVEIKRLQDLLDASETQSSQIETRISDINKELEEIQHNKEKWSAEQEERWEELKQQYSSTEDTSDPIATERLFSITQDSIRADETAAQLRKELKTQEEKLMTNRETEQELKAQIKIHNGMKFIIRKDIAYQNFTYGTENEQHRIDELLAIQEEINDMKIVTAIQPPLTREQMQTIHNDLEMVGKKLRGLNYPPTSALFHAIARTRNVLLSHLQLLRYLFMIKDVDPERRMTVEDQVLEDFVWGSKPS